MKREQPIEPPTRCEACRRQRWHGPAMELTDVDGVGRTLLCKDAADCRRNWPKELAA